MEALLLESERLIYRPLNLSFVSQAYVDWMNDEEVNRYLESGGDYTINTLRDFLGEIEKKSILFWAIIIKASGKHIGNIKIDPISKRNKTGEYGILIGDKKEWGKGYAREATNSILKYCFSENVQLRKVTLGVVFENESALALYKKLGFRQEGLLKNHALHLGMWCDVVRMAIFNPNLNLEN